MHTLKHFKVSHFVEKTWTDSAGVSQVPGGAMSGRVSAPLCGQIEKWIFFWKANVFLPKL